MIVGIFLEGNRVSSRIANEIKRINSGEPAEVADQSDDEYEVYEHKDASEYDEETVTGSVISRSFAAKTLGLVKAIDDEDESVLSEEVDFDFATCFQQQETQGKLAKLKEMTIDRFMKRKVRPSHLR